MEGPVSNNPDGFIWLFDADFETWILDFINSKNPQMGKKREWSRALSYVGHINNDVSKYYKRIRSIINDSPFVTHDMMKYISDLAIAADIDYACKNIYGSDVLTKPVINTLVITIVIKLRKKYGSYPYTCVE